MALHAAEHTRNRFTLLAVVDSRAGVQRSAAVMSAAASESGGVAAPSEKLRVSSCSSANGAGAVLVVRTSASLRRHGDSDSEPPLLASLHCDAADDQHALLAHLDQIAQLPLRDDAGRHGRWINDILSLRRSVKSGGICHWAEGRGAEAQRGGEPSAEAEGEATVSGSAPLRSARPVRCPVDRGCVADCFFFVVVIALQRLLRRCTRSVAHCQRKRETAPLRSRLARPVGEGNTVRTDRREGEESRDSTHTHERERKKRRPGEEGGRRERDSETPLLGERSALGFCAATTRLAITETHAQRCCHVM